MHGKHKLRFSYTFFLYRKQWEKNFLFPFLYLYLKAEIVVSRVKAHIIRFQKKNAFLYSFHVCQKICHRHLPYHTFTHFASTLTLFASNSVDKGIGSMTVKKTRYTLI